MPKEKITMGLAAYGRTFKLVDESNTEIGAPSSAAGDPGKYTKEPGFLSYYEVCSTTMIFHCVQNSPFRFVRN